jgi:hypothetical protein
MILKTRVGTSMQVEDKRIVRREFLLKTGESSWTIKILISTFCPAA